MHPASHTEIAEAQKHVADDFSLKAFCGFRGAELSESHEKERQTRNGRARESRRGSFSRYAKHRGERISSNDSA